MRYVTIIVLLSLLTYIAYALEDCSTPKTMPKWCNNICDYECYRNGLSQWVKNITRSRKLILA